MLKIYNQTTPLTFPSGTTYTPEQLAVHDVYKDLMMYTCVISIDGDGVTSSWQHLETMKDAYNITESDPEAALALCIEAQEEQARKQAELDAARLDDASRIQAQLNEQAEAIMELAAILTEGE